MSTQLPIKELDDAIWTTLFASDNFTVLRGTDYRTTGVVNDPPETPSGALVRMESVDLSDEATLSASGFRVVRNINVFADPKKPSGLTALIEEVDSKILNISEIDGFNSLSVVRRGIRILPDTANRPTVNRAYLTYEFRCMKS